MASRLRFSGSASWAFPMAGHLKAKGGHEVTVYNRTAAKAEKLGHPVRRHERTDADASRRRPGHRDGLRRQRR